MDDTLRKAYEEFKAQLLGVAGMQEDMNQKAQTKGERVQIPLEGRNIEAVIFRSPDPEAETIFCAHGGGFLLGGCAMDSLMWETLSARLKKNLISVGYRKGPEHRFPEGLFDFYDTLCYFKENGEQYGLQTRNFSVLGASAGANLATAAAMLDIQRDSGLIDRQYLLYPYLDLVTEPVKKGHAPGELFMYRLFQECYTQNQEDLSKPLVSPVFASAEELTGMPETVLIYGGEDPLKAEDQIYGDRLRQAGTVVHAWEAEGMDHGFLEFAFSLQYTPLEMSFCSDKTKEQFRSGILWERTQQAIQFMEESVR